MLSGSKCFERFFKHTWHPQQMENTSCKDPEITASHTRDTELLEVKVAMPMASVGTAMTTLSSPSPALPEWIPCERGGCKTSKSRSESRSESPWHQLKTIFLVSVIVALIMWILRPGTIRMVTLAAGIATVLIIVASASVTMRIVSGLRVRNDSNVLFEYDSA